MSTTEEKLAESQAKLSTLHRELVELNILLGQSEWRNDHAEIIDEARVILERLFEEEVLDSEKPGKGMVSA